MNIPFESILTKEFLDKHLQTKSNVWFNTPLEKYFTFSSKTQGALGESFVTEYMIKKGHIVNERKNSGHDAIIDNYKTEIKFTLCRSDTPDKGVTINHLSLQKDFERCIIFIMNRNEENCRFLWFSKEDLHILIQQEIFKHQQGGKKLGLDDYMCSGKDVKRLIQHHLAKGYNEWSMYKTTSTKDTQLETYRTPNLNQWLEN